MRPAGAVTNHPTTMARRPDARHPRNHPQRMRKPGGLVSAAVTSTGWVVTVPGSACDSRASKRWRPPPPQQHSGAGGGQHAAPAHPSCMRLRRCRPGRHPGRPSAAETRSRAQELTIALWAASSNAPSSAARRAACARWSRASAAPAAWSLPRVRIAEPDSGARLRLSWSRA
jgi:hypothetical protein